MNIGFYLTLSMGPNKAVPVPQPVIEALSSVQVTCSAGQRSGFQMTFTMGKNSPLAVNFLPNGFFDPQTRVIISVIVNGLVSVLMDGVITQQQLTPSNEAGQSTLTITGEDLSRLMDLHEITGNPNYQNQTPEDRVQTILQGYEQYGITADIRPCVPKDAPNARETVPQHKGTDLDYITILANEVGHVFYLDPGPIPGLVTAYWGPERKTDPLQPALSVNMDGHSNVESLNFTYDAFSKTNYFIHIQDPDTGEPVDVKVQDISALNPPMGAKALPAFRREKMTVPDGYTSTKAQLIAMARASQSADVVTASGQLDVLRYGQVLRSRQPVGVRGAGVTYDGIYYVRSTTHNIKPGEYKQSFTLSRNALVSFTPNLPV
jgi:hypothetical protein